MRAISGIGSRGFTLLELLVVLAIIVLLASAWPLASSRVFAAQHLRNESQQLAAAVRLAQMTARVTGAPQELAVASDATAYQVAGELHKLPAGLTLHILGISGLKTPFVLFPDGSSTDAQLTLSLNQRVATLRVLPVTGRLEVTL